MHGWPDPIWYFISDKEDGQFCLRDCEKVERLDDHWLPYVALFRLKNGKKIGVTRYPMDSKLRQFFELSEKDLERYRKPDTAADSPPPLESHEKTLPKSCSESIEATK